MLTRTLPRPANTRGQPTSACPAECAIAGARLVCIVSCMLSACAEASSTPTGAAGTAGMPDDDAGAAQDSGADGGLVCAEPVAMSPADPSLGPGFAIGELRGRYVSVRDGAGSTGI